MLSHPQKAGSAQAWVLDLKIGHPTGNSFPGRPVQLRRAEKSHILLSAARSKAGFWHLTESNTGHTVPQELYRKAQCNCQLGKRFPTLCLCNCVLFRCLWSSSGLRSVLLKYLECLCLPQRQPVLPAPQGQMRSRCALLSAPSPTPALPACSLHGA